jgi:hypothetical protein
LERQHAIVGELLLGALGRQGELLLDEMADTALKVL